MPKIATLCLLIVFFGCDNAPRVRLVKDNHETFHIQWDKPLKEERIILVRSWGEVGEYIYEGGTQKWKSPGLHYTNYFVYFPVESFVSPPVFAREQGWELDGRSISRQHSAVQILGAHRREDGYTVDLPAPCM